jgi:beta-glucosidase-like glycosyl hydrolase
LLDDVLRKEWAFKGFVVADASGVDPSLKQGVATSKGEAASLALNAGSDMADTIPGFLKSDVAVAQTRAFIPCLDDEDQPSAIHKYLGPSTFPQVIGELHQHVGVPYPRDL